ncbi:hypothetical protein Pla123a_36480 [Posidoniimonas polymericola]|uniref:Uncharacterized protein n=1 Tax=Posidoniimonas polymericola TaxID=2528002 RepID=A0A5C5YGY8_9BACT|nr:hypothetical protein [Posidoniimonas polymericola]TWT73755.1 hypothetical protein Pla123a_36480 [Posidoniimonas polymericola]
MDPLRTAIALVPLASYLLLLGLVNLRGRPLVTTGANDLATLCVALSGVVFVGPLELFRPEPATIKLGAYVWLLLLGLYWLCVSLAAMILRPRLTIYNITLEQLRPAVAEAVSQVDPDARWAGDSLVLPRLQVQLHLDSFASMRHASLVSSGGNQSLEGWWRLKRALIRSLQDLSVGPNPRSVTFLTGALVLFGLSVAGLVAAPEQVAQAWASLTSF